MTIELNVNLRNRGKFMKHYILNIYASDQSEVLIQITQYIITKKSRITLLTQTPIIYLATLIDFFNKILNHKIYLIFANFRQKCHTSEERRCKK